MEEIQLFAPTGDPIAGVVSDDGSSRPFRYSYDRSTKTSLYVLSDGSPLSDESVQLVDVKGRRWSSSDVEWYTLFERRE